MRCGSAAPYLVGKDSVSGLLTFTLQYGQSALSLRLWDGAPDSNSSRSRSRSKKDIEYWLDEAISLVGIVGR